MGFLLFFFFKSLYLLSYFSGRLGEIVLHSLNQMPLYLYIFLFCFQEKVINSNTEVHEVEIKILSSTSLPKSHSSAEITGKSGASALLGTLCHVMAVLSELISTALITCQALLQARCVCLYNPLWNLMRYVLWMRRPRCRDVRGVVKVTQLASSRAVMKI